MNSDAEQPTLSTPTWPDAQDLEMDRRCKQVEERARTLGEFIKLIFSEVLWPNMGHFPIAQDAKFYPRVMRFCEPWPDWALRVYAEIIEVKIPTVPKAIILEHLRFLHFFIFDVEIHGKEMGKIPHIRGDSGKVFAAIAGHVFEHFEKALKDGKLTPTKTAENSAAGNEAPEVWTMEKFQKTFVPSILKSLQFSPEKFLDFNSAFNTARKNTFDKKGFPKESPLTPIYRKIFWNWPEIEQMSGPKALCEYLSPHLGHQHPDEKYERVKKICQRMQIAFKPFVKGQ